MSAARLSISPSHLSDFNLKVPVQYTVPLPSHHLLSLQFIFFHPSHPIPSVFPHPIHLTCLASISKFLSCTHCSSRILFCSAMVSRSPSRSWRYSSSAWMWVPASYSASDINCTHTEEKLHWNLHWTELCTTFSWQILTQRLVSLGKMKVTVWVGPNTGEPHYTVDPSSATR